MEQDKFIHIIQNIVENYITKKGLFIHEWHLGLVSTVNIGNTLDVYIDGNTVVTPNVPCNPNYDFVVGDYVWVQYVNRKSSNIFIPSRRSIGDKRIATGTGSESIPLASETTDGLMSSTDYTKLESIKLTNTYTFTQLSPAMIWTITHNLNTYPSVTIVDSAGSQVVGDISYVSINQITITFTTTFAGKAYLN